MRFLSQRLEIADNSLVRRLAIAKQRKSEVGFVKQVLSSSNRTYTYSSSSKNSSLRRHSIASSCLGCDFASNTRSVTCIHRPNGFPFDSQSPRFSREWAYQSLGIRQAGLLELGSRKDDFIVCISKYNDDWRCGGEYRARDERNG